MQKKNLYILGLVTLIIFPLVGLTIVGVVEDNPTEWLQKRLDRERLAVHWQVLIGLLFGALSGFLGWQIIRLPFMESVRNKYGSILQKLNLNFFDILFISFCAGVGEELLFRGAIQPYLGIWVTAILFVAIHGYLNPMDLKITVYGIFMTAIIAALGYFAQDFGILTAIVAHFAIDVVLLLYSTQTNLNESD